MKKEVKKYAVIQSFTKDDIKADGFKRWFNKRKNTIIFYMLAIIIVVPFGLGLESDNLIYNYIISVLGLGVFIYYLVMYIRESKKFFNKVKDLPEPIDLRGIK